MVCPGKIKIQTACHVSEIAAKSHGISDGLPLGRVIQQRISAIAIRLSSQPTQKLLQQA
jgi:hypothetical protein